MLLLLLLLFLIDKLCLTFYTEMESARNKNTVLKKEVRGLILLGFKIYYKTVVVKTVVTGVRLG